MPAADNNPIQQLAVHAWHLEQGAKFMPFAGYSLPLQYPAGILAEASACRNKAVIFDVSHMGQFMLQGTDTTALLEQLSPGNLADLKIGSMFYTLLLNSAGGIIDDCIISKFAGDRFGLIANASRKDVVQQQLTEHLKPAQHLEALPDRCLFALQGPTAAEKLQAMLEQQPITPVQPLSRLTFMQCQELDCKGEVVRISRCGYTGEDGFELSLPRSLATNWISTLCEQFDVLPAGLGARDILRIEAGLPLYGADITTETTPVDVGLTWVIAKQRRRKGLFPGSEKILSQLANPPEHRLVGLKINGKQPVRPPALLSKAENRTSSPLDAAFGRVTSAAISPTLGPIAIAHLDRGVEIGQEVNIWYRNKPIAANRCKLPFIPHSYYRG